MQLEYYLLLNNTCMVLYYIFNFKITLEAAIVFV